VRIGILCGGGPAPGFNGVINSVTLAAHSRGWTVIGIPYGYRDLMRADTNHCYELTRSDVADIATRGGGILFTNRANPKKSPEAMSNVVKAITELDLDALVTVGGDDTATSAANVAAAIAAAGGKDLRVAHVPKTIDNDLPLPGGAPTFGFETAKQVGATLCHNLRVDAITTSRWYLITAMGRSAGHLSLGIAMASNADLAIIREELEPESPVKLDRLADMVIAAIKQRRFEGQRGGLVVMAEGILELLDRDDLANIAELESDEHGNARMSEVDLGRAVRDAVAAKLEDAPAFITKLIGYELRCADPCAFDVQYTRALGSAAVAFLDEGAGSGMICIENGQARALRFEELRDQSGRIPVRRLDVQSDQWKDSLALQARAT
jgi:6-phosphofructokinase